MSRQYQTKATMFVDRLTDNVVQPDAQLVAQLHGLLDMIPDVNHALMIDHTVADLLRFHNPKFRAPGTMTIELNGSGRESNA